MSHHRNIHRLPLVASVLGALLLGGCGAPNAPVPEGHHKGAELAFPGRRGEVTRGQVMLPGLGLREMTYEKIDGQAVVGGDILLPGPQEGIRSGQSAARLDEQYQWSGGYIPYVIDASLTDPQRVQDAINEWQSKTPVTFGVRYKETDYVLFKAGSGCSSYVGKMGGMQVVQLADQCSRGSVIHEIGHVIGLWHEQSRADRDDTVIIHLENVDDSDQYVFDTYLQDKNDGIEIGPYDVGSIMHYGSWDFSKNTLPTITRKDGTTFESQRDKLSDDDVRDVESLYGMHLRLHSGLGMSLCLDLANGSAASGTNVQLGTCSQGDAQHWIMTARGELRSALVPDRCLDVENDNKARGANVRLWDCNGTNAQQWFLSSQGTVISLPNANLCLDVENSNTAPGTNVRLWDCNGTNAQQWNGSIWLRSALSWNLCLDVNSADTSVGAKVQTWACNDTNAQEWFLTAANEVRSAVAPNRCLDVENANTAPGTEVRSWECNGTAAQKWSLTSQGDLRSLLGDNLCLGVPGASTAPGTGVQLWDCNGTQAQKWFRP